MKQPEQGFRVKRHGGLMTLQELLAPLTNHLYFAIFISVIGLAYVLIWAVSLVELIGPRRGHSFSPDLGTMENQKASAPRVSRRLRPRGIYPRGVSSLQKTHELRNQRTAKASARAA